MKYIELLETVQHRATKILPSIVNLTYEQRLRKFGLPTLAYHTVRDDMIQVYKMMHGLYGKYGCPNLPI